MLVFLCWYFGMEEEMLGGSIWVAALRNVMGAGLMMAVFLLLDRPRLSMKKTIWCYVLFGMAAVVCFSLWYLVDKESFVRFSGMLLLPVMGTFCVRMSRDTLYLSLYKLTIGFYLLSLTVFCGIDAARIWFGEEMWADILIRLVMTVVILFLIASKVRRSFLEGIDYLREEMDWFSSVTVVLSILIAAIVAFWPGRHDFSMFHVVRTVMLFFMAGIIQYTVFQLYLHRGKEWRFQVEKELLETNERFIHRQLELMNESKEQTARIRHDIRHHCLLIEEYIRNGETDKLLDYVKQYREDVENREPECICGNETISNILTVYARRAKKEDIEVAMQAQVPGDIAVRDTDLVVIIANIFENAIHGCMASHLPENKIHIQVTCKGKKIVVQCRNTCGEDIKMKNGVPVSERGIGISSVLKVVSYYHGEAEFSVENGMFIARILLNLPQDQ